MVGADGPGARDSAPGSRDALRRQQGYQQVKAATVGAWGPPLGEEPLRPVRVSHCQTHLGVFFALWERGELQLHVLHGPGPRVCGWGRVGVGVTRRPTLGQAVAVKGKVDRRTDREAAGLQLTHADYRVPATAAATAGKRVGRLVSGRHAAAVFLPPCFRAPQAAQALAPTRALQPSPLLPPPSVPAQPQPIPAYACLRPAPPAAARCQRAAAPPLRERADAGGRGPGGARAGAR